MNHVVFGVSNLCRRVPLALQIFIINLLSPHSRKCLPKTLHPPQVPTLVASTRVSGIPENKNTLISCMICGSVTYRESGFTTPFRSPYHQGGFIFYL